MKKLFAVLLTALFFSLGSAYAAILVYDGEGTDSEIISAVEELGYEFQSTYYLSTPTDPLSNYLPLSNYDAVIIGWNYESDMSGIGTALDAIDGNILLTGHDADVHVVHGYDDDSTDPTDTAVDTAATKFLSQAIDWASAGSGTGLVALGDFSTAFSYLPAAWGISATGGVNRETVFGYTVDGAGSGVYTELTDADMSNWGHSYHARFDGWDTSRFVAFEVGEFGDIVTIAREAPTVATYDATDVGTHTATLNGDLTSLGTASSVDVSFEYGTSSGSYTDETTSQSMTATGPFSASLSGLSPGTTYYFRAKASGGGTGHGDEKEFTTLTEPPTVATYDATGVGTHTAILNGDLTSLGTASPVNVSFVWGTEPQADPAMYPYETTSPPMTEPGPFSASLSGLSPGTIYYFRAKASSGHGTSHGDEKEFTTLTEPPTVATNDATGVGTDTAILNGDLTSLGTASSVDVSFEYSTSSGSYTDETPAESKTETGAFSASLSGLSPDTTYYFRAKASGHGTSYGDEKEFTTLPPPGPCEGKVSELTLQYNGEIEDALVRVEQKQGKEKIVVFEGIVQPGGQFQFTGQDKHGTLGPEIEVFVNGVLNTTIHTSCSQPIGPGLISGDFEVISGRSSGEGASLYPVPWP